MVSTFWSCGDGGVHILRHWSGYIVYGFYGALNLWFNWCWYFVVWWFSHSEFVLFAFWCLQGLWILCCWCSLISLGFFCVIYIHYFYVGGVHYLWVLWLFVIFIICGFSDVAGVHGSLWFSSWDAHWWCSSYTFHLGCGVGFWVQGVSGAHVLIFIWGCGVGGVHFSCWNWCCLICGVCGVSFGHVEVFIWGCEFYDVALILPWHYMILSWSSHDTHVVIL